MASQPLHTAILTAPVLVATSVGLCLNASFAIGTYALSSFALPAILLPADYTLAPPLKLVEQRRSQHKLNAAPDKKISLQRPADDDKDRQSDVGQSTKHTPSTNAYLLRQWFYVFQKGMYSFPPMALGGFMSYVFCAYMLPGPIRDNALQAIATKRILYVLAALFSISITPFTLTVLKPTNEALSNWIEQVVKKEESNTESSVKATSEQDKLESERLIKDWARINGYRGLLPVVAAVFAVSAMIA